MRARIGQLLQHVVQRVAPAEDPELVRVVIDDLEEIREAHRQLEAAKAYFESVSEPGLVDHAIAVLTAAERRFAYLIGRARAHGLADAEVERVLGVRLPELPLQAMQALAAGTSGIESPEDMPPPRA